MALTRLHIYSRRFDYYCHFRPTSRRIFLPVPSPRRDGVYNFVAIKFLRISMMIDGSILGRLHYAASPAALRRIKYEPFRRRKAIVIADFRV